MSQKSSAIRMLAMAGVAVLMVFASWYALPTAQSAPLAAPCDTLANPIVAENCLTGNPSNEWEVSGDWGNALVLGAGTIQWSWGLDSNHDIASPPISPVMQQATVNL